jgi:hypothetical protein
MTPPKCRDICKSRGFEISGTQNGNQCYCGVSTPLKKVADTQWSTPCAGDKTVTCGGSWRLSVYGPGGQAGVSASAGSTTAAAPRRRSRSRVQTVG